MVEIKGAEIINKDSSKIRVHIEGLGTFIADNFEALEEFKDQIMQMSIHYMNLRSEFPVESKLYGHFLDKGIEYMQLWRDLHEICKQYRYDMKQKGGA